MLKRGIVGGREKGKKGFKEGRWHKGRVKEGCRKLGKNGWIECCMVRGGEFKIEMEGELEGSRERWKEERMVGELKGVMKV